MSAPTERAVWFNCSAGVAGDMVLAALIDAGADKLAVIDAWSALGLDGYAATFERVQRCGISSLWANIIIEHDHDHDHDHEHEHEHEHRKAREVIEMIEATDLPPTITRRAVDVYRALAVVEGRVHGLDPDEVELHEVGALDSILDVVGVAAALHSLAITQIFFSPIAIGHGTVQTAHGRLANPVPAVSHLLADFGVDTIGIDTTMELATPTGVALMTVLGNGSGPMPSMRVIATGFGAGTADPAGRPNVVQAIIGETGATTTTADPAGRRAYLVEVNVDDVTGEVIAHTIDRLLRRAGAHDAWATPIIMKKGRPAHTVSALCDAASFDAVRSTLLSETGSLGVRATEVQRWPQQRTETTVSVWGHSIRVKVTGDRVKVEYDDALDIATRLGKPLRSVLSAAESAALDQPMPR